MFRRLLTYGLYGRFLGLCLSLSVIVMVVALAVFYTYRAERFRTQLTTEITVLAGLVGPFVSVALREGRQTIAAKALQVFPKIHHVSCVEFEHAGEGKAAWPRAGCPASEGRGTTIVIPLPELNGTDASLTAQVNAPAMRQQLLVETVYFAMSLFIAMMALFVALSLLFKRIILTPLGLLEDAMEASTPRGPVRAPVVHDDEIGALVRIYNKLVAGSRLYIRRLDQSQAKLATSEQRFRDLAVVSGDWFFEIDSDLTFTYVSDGFYQRSGLAQEDVIGLPSQALALEDARSPHWRRHLDDLAAHREFKRFEYRLRGADGGAIDVSLSGVPLFDDSGEFTGYRGVGTDISDIKEKERQLAEANRNFGDSVSYASSIQRGLLTDPETLSAHLGSARAVWQPKDVVGGDFYWIKTIANVHYLVFFDCTGHGVPGAFMTLIVTSVLDQIAVSAPSALPARQMLQLVHDGVCRSLGIDKASPGIDGLDCAVVRLNRSEDSLEFAGASIDLYTVDENGTVTRHRGARTTLGYEMRDGPLQIEPISLHVGNLGFVMTTDGLLTQIGAATGRVLGTRRFEAALAKAGGNAPANLVRALARLLKTWQGHEDRRDDISFIAFKPNAF